MKVIPLILRLFDRKEIFLLGGIGGIASVAFFLKNSQKDKLGVLGMQQAGKTRFLSFLRGVPFDEGQTSRKDYDDFVYKLSNGKKIYIKAGKDIGGDDMYRGDYNEVISESDVLLYFFDIDKYLNDNNRGYRRDCNSRFEHIYDQAKARARAKAKAKAKGIPDMVREILGRKFPIIIIATHKDKCSYGDSEMKQKFDSLVQNKPYKNMLNEVQYVNLTNDTETRRLADKIFKGE